MNMDKLKKGSKVKVVAPERDLEQIGEGIGYVEHIEEDGIWIKLRGSNQFYLDRLGTFFTLSIPIYKFTVLKY